MLKAEVGSTTLIHHLMDNSAPTCISEFVFLSLVAASYLADLPASEWHTYGLKRAESLAALLSMLSLVFVSLGLAYEAIVRLINTFGNGVVDENIDGPLMSLVAGIGVMVNIVLAFVLGE